MTNCEIEPVFGRILKLLHSNVKDSADGIKTVLEEVIEQKYNGTKTLNLKSGTFLEEPIKSSDATQRSVKLSRGCSPVLVSIAGQGGEKSRDSSPPSEPLSTTTTPDLEDNDIALEIFEDDLNCKICKGMSVGPRNRLVECSDCHMLYHQECHKPPISENVNDPRLVWYCSSCTKKTQEKVQPKIKPIHLDTAQKKLKSEVVTENKNSVFKRNEKSSGSSHSKNASGSGMAHLAASIQGANSSSKHLPASNLNNKSSSSLNYGKTPNSPNPKLPSGSAPAPANIIAADKRLQNMKKKAAAKMQEKRAKHK